MVPSELRGNNSRSDKRQFASSLATDFMATFLALCWYRLLFCSYLHPSSFSRYYFICILRILIHTQLPLELLLVPFCHMALTAEWTGRSTVLKPLQVLTPTQTRVNCVKLLVAIAAFTRKTEQTTRNYFRQLSDLLHASQHPALHSRNWSSELKPQLELQLPAKYPL